METDFNKPIFQKQQQPKVIKETVKPVAKQPIKVPSLKVPSIGNIQFADDVPGRILNKIKNWLPLVLVALVVLLAVWAIFSDVIGRWF